MRTIILMLLLMLVLACASEVEVPKLNPNIVIVLADDLGYGDLSCYGNKIIQTPNLDLLAANGMKFTDFHSNGSVCSPTRAALMTGRYPLRTGVGGVITAKSHRNKGLHLDEITIAEELKEAGYRCGMVGKWHLGYSKEHNPILQGFDEYTGFVSGNIDYHAHIDQEGYLDWWQGQEIDNEEGYSTDLITSKSVDFIKRNNPKETGKPIFLYIAHEAPHGPYQKRIDKSLRVVGKAGSTPVDQDSIPMIYKEMVEVMDEGIGDVMEVLKATGQYDNTIFIFLSDNGANRYGSNGTLKGFKGSAYEGGSRVPAIISYPSMIKGGVVSSQTLFSMDILPTLLEFIDRKPSAKKVDGISFKQHLVNESVVVERDVFFAFQNRKYVRSGDWKLVSIGRKGQEKVELYKLSDDIGELKDISAQEIELTRDLSLRLKKWEVEVRKGVKVVSN